MAAVAPTSYILGFKASGKVCLLIAPSKILRPELIPAQPRTVDCLESTSYVSSLRFGAEFQNKFQSVIRRRGKTAGEFKQK